MCPTSLRKWMLTCPESSTYAAFASSPCKQITSPGISSSVRRSFLHIELIAAASMPRMKEGSSIESACTTASTRAPSRS